MKSVSRVTTVILVTLALAAGVALADNPESTPTTVASSIGSTRQPSSAVAAAGASESVAVPEVVTSQPAAPPDGSSVVVTEGAALAATGTDACAQIGTEKESINAAFDQAEQRLQAVLPAGTLEAVVAVLEASKSRVLADLDAAFAACTSATSTTSTSTSSSTSTTTAPLVTCPGLAAQKAAVNARFDAAEAQLRSIITGSELTAAIASIEAARTQTNAGIDAAIAACASASSSTSSTTPTNVSTTLPVASCAEIRAQRATFSSQIDAAEAQLGGTLAAGSPQLATAISGIEAGRARGNAGFDAALAKC